MRNLKAEYLGEVDFQVGGTNRTIALSVWCNPETGRAVAIDNMEVDAGTNSIPDPYTEGVRLVFHDTFSGLPK